MRQFNTTSVNLRAALDDLHPLVNATRPVARKLQPFAERLRGFARDAVPTVQGLNAIIRAPGPEQRPDRAHRCRTRWPRSGSAR